MPGEELGDQCFFTFPGVAVLSEPGKQLAREDKGLWVQVSRISGSKREGRKFM